MTVDSNFLRSTISYFYRSGLYDDDESQNIVNTVTLTLQQVGSSVHHFPPPAECFSSLIGYLSPFWCKITLIRARTEDDGG